MYGFTAPPTIGPGRTMATWIVMLVERLRARAVQRRHLRAALDLEDAGRVAPPGSRRTSPGRRRGCGRGRCARRGATRCGRRSARRPRASRGPSRSIFRKPASEQESLSHCASWRPSIAAGTSGTQSTSGRVDDDHPARVLGEVARQPVRLLRQRGEPRPAAAPLLPLAQRDGDVACRRPAPTTPRWTARDALDLPRRQPERLADLADRRRARGTSGTPRRAPSARGRSARARAG